MSVKTDENFQIEKSLRQTHIAGLAEDDNFRKFREQVKPVCWQFLGDSERLWYVNTVDISPTEETFTRSPGGKTAFGLNDEIGRFVAYVQESFPPTSFSRLLVFSSVL